MWGFSIIKPKSLFVWLTLVALALHSLIPQGYMPAASGVGLMVCDGVHHHQTSDANGKSTDDICPFSALVFAATLDVATPPVLSPQVITWIAFLVVLATGLLPSRNVAYARPRAPPVI